VGEETWAVDADNAVGRRPGSWLSEMGEDGKAVQRLYSEGPLLGDKAKRGTFLRRAASNGAGYGHIVRQKLDFRRSEVLSQELIQEQTELKSPGKGWKKLMFSMDLFQGTSMGAGLKRAGSRKERVRSSSFSSTKSEITPPDAPAGVTKGSETPSWKGSIAGHPADPYRGALKGVQQGSWMDRKDRCLRHVVYTADLMTVCSKVISAERCVQS
jgi:hypothetical protein